MVDWKKARLAQEEMREMLREVPNVKGVRLSPAGEGEYLLRVSLWQDRPTPEVLEQLRGIPVMTEAPGQEPKPVSAGPIAVL